MAFKNLVVTVYIGWARTMVEIWLRWLSKHIGDSVQAVPMSPCLQSFIITDKLIFLIINFLPSKKSVRKKPKP